MVTAVSFSIGSQIKKFSTVVHPLSILIVSHRNRHRGICNQLNLTDAAFHRSLFIIAVTRHCPLSDISLCVPKVVASFLTMSNPAPLKTTEGEVAFNVPGADKPCKTWYKIIGDLHGSPSRRPLVALHGGPGVNHAYLLVLSDLTERHGIPLVVYDQIGNGNSTHLPEKMGDTTFWTEQLFLDELDNLLTHLAIKDAYDIIGHSWGGMLGSRHASMNPVGLKRLILASTPADMQLWVKSQNELRAQLPEDVQAVLDQHEKDGTTESAEYQAAVGVFYSKFLCRIDPLPEPVAEGFGWIQKDPTVYLTMNGPSEFYITGPLKDWSILDDAGKIQTPTLILNGRYDEAQDIVVAPFFESIPRVKWVTFAESSHMIHFEERERYMQVVGDFLMSEFKL
ncbi:Proline iminopeptidase [Mycena indigotica]|uniref:Proline iminopeptidase n=1 Tax=Mycena indigotica TaxID=2126181 RepID=A0A8H6TCE0_9AGAR|nr:Proline iminopeptidase [Mycena indigotica]KAF7315973.1 Proline iminopeptidase [Mycena indigotica]